MSAVGVEGLAFLAHLREQTDAERKLTNLVNRQRNAMHVAIDALDWCAKTYDDPRARMALEKFEELKR